MPSLLPGYEYDIFISYRQKDNKGDHWVTEFVNALRGELEATFKEDISIYFDENPHDGLLETHQVGDSLEQKLKCLIFIPVISQTYCDPKCFAWNHEFLAFRKLAGADPFGEKIKLTNGNVASRILPVRIHDLDPADKALLENEIGPIRAIDFIFRSPGVNRPLRIKDDDVKEITHASFYRDQINKVANNIKEIIAGLRRAGISTNLTSPQPVLAAKDEVTFLKEQKPDTQGWSLKKVLIILALMSVIGVTGFSVNFARHWMKEQEAKNILIPEIQKITEDDFVPSIKAYQLAVEARKILPEDATLKALWPRVSRTFSITTDPPGAKVFWKDYNDPSENWNYIGITPLEKISYPRGFNVLKIEKEGFTEIISAINTFIPSVSLRLDSLGRFLGMVRMQGAATPMLVVGLEKMAGAFVDEFLIDRLEVRNSDYKEFLDAGGYTNEAYWKYPIEGNERPLKWEDAMKLFIDKTGRPGPATWEAGTFPDGQADHPVSGISWYEAAAFAEYTGKQLPTVYHWSRIANTWNNKEILSKSNFNGKGTVQAGSLGGINYGGTLDVAGNVREWCLNRTGKSDQRFILGGGWNDPDYAYNDAYSQSSLDRSPSNGFRCVKILPGDTTFQTLSKALQMDFRDYKVEKPVNDDVFNIFLRQYAYDHSPFHEELTTILDSNFVRIEKISLDASYGNERIIAYLFLPKNSQKTFQTIVFFPGSNVISLRKFEGSIPSALRSFNFLLKSGRAVLYPVFKGTFERGGDLRSDLQEETVAYKDYVTSWVKDVGRSLDYLDTRSDIVHGKFGYLGFSWGSAVAPIVLAVEKRISASVLHVGGFMMQKTLAEADPLNFTSRVKSPVLMLNGRNDTFFPLETSQKPMFQSIGTEEKDKKMIVYEGAHVVPWSELIKESLFWYDKYLGPVK